MKSWHILEYFLVKHDLKVPNLRKVTVYYSDICKSELRQSDRRAAMCVENIFYKAKLLQMKILLGKSHSP